MKILIYGSNGWIGKQFCNFINNQCTKGKERVDDLIKVINEINRIKPTHIILFIGRTHGPLDNTIDYLENNLDENIRDNLYAPIQMAILCKQNNIHLTYIGTGCIYDGDKQFKETDIPNYTNSSYSIIKGYTDRLITMFDILNLRIRLPISNNKHPRNLITKITNYKQIINGDKYNSITILPDMFPIIIDMMKNDITGSFNMTNPGSISHNEILQIYKDIVDSTFTWINHDNDNNRCNNTLSSTKLKSYYPDIKDIHESLKNCLKNYK